MSGFFSKSLIYLKGIGPDRAEHLKSEIGITNYADLIQYYPFRYEDRTKFYKVSELSEALPHVQVLGTIRRFELIGFKRKQRLKAVFADDTGEMELTWFQGVKWIQQKIKPGVAYIAFGKPNNYGGKISIAHPELELKTEESLKSITLYPVYHTTEKLKRRFFDSKAISKIQKQVIREALPHIQETLPPYLKSDYQLIDKKSALVSIHFPKTPDDLKKARYRLKFEELFYIQLRLIKLKIGRAEKFRGFVFSQSELLKTFYEDHLPFPLTGAQKRVIKEIYGDFRNGRQMNRLIQGDVGSGKTIVAFLCMLIAVGNDTQCALMAPTEILVEQHFDNIVQMASLLGLRVEKLTGSTKTAKRRELREELENGTINILVGTHALIEEKVKFKNLGLAVIDEQHRFGVAQRAKLWQKNDSLFPHILVMTATPIPRTLALTLYGDLDISVIDELPPGRKPVKTIHFRDSHRLTLFGLLEQEMKKGHQVYIVYPLIEESEKLDYKDLMDGYESICRRYPHVPISILHGKMKPEAKDYEMQRFVRNETKIMVATTVIEVGVNVPNASVMVVENAEKFGLSQLHQLRGRVGRGAEQSYCLLMTGHKLTKEAKLRIEKMVETSDGFKIAEADLELRGPGDMMGTQQSGALDLLISDLGADGRILQLARDAATHICDEDPDFVLQKNQIIKRHISNLNKDQVNWSKIG